MKTSALLSICVLLLSVFSTHGLSPIFTPWFCLGWTNAWNIGPYRSWLQSNCGVTVAPVTVAPVTVAPVTAAPATVAPVTVAPATTPVPAPTQSPTQCPNECVKYICDTTCHDNPNLSPSGRPSPTGVCFENNVRAPPTPSAPCTDVACATNQYCPYATCNPTAPKVACPL